VFTAAGTRGLARTAIHLLLTDAPAALNFPVSRKAPQRPTGCAG